MLMFFAVLLLLRAQASWGNPEKEDCIYYTVRWREEPPLGAASPKNHKFGETDYFFEEISEKEELNKAPNTIDQINRMIELREKKLSHSDGTTKITLVPFGSIQLESEETRINIGKYHHTYKGKENIIQSYRNGDQCDICRGKRWKGTIIYKVDKGPLELTGPVESSTCNFTLVVKGEDLAVPEKYRVLAVYKKEKHAQTVKPEQEQQKQEETKQERKPHQRKIHQPRILRPNQTSEIVLI